MTDDQEAADSLATLLDYYVGGDEVSPDRAQNAWETLIAHHGNHLVDWNGRHLRKQFRPRGQALPLPNTDDPEDCCACVDVDGDCWFHTGVLSGATSTLRDTADAVKAFARDPELIEMVLAQDEENRSLEQQKRVRENQPEPEGLTEHEKEVRDAVNEAARDNTGGNGPDATTEEEGQG